MSEFLRIYENVKRNLVLSELYTVPDLAMVSLKLYQIKNSFHPNMPKLKEFAWPFVAFLHESGLYDKPFAKKRHDTKAFFPAWKGHQWITGKKYAERPWFVESIFPPFESQVRPVEQLSLQDLPYLIGLYELLDLQKQFDFPYRRLVRRWLKKHPYSLLCNEFGLRVLGSKYFGSFPTFNLNIRDSLIAFINTQQHQASLDLLLNGTGIYLLSHFYPFLSMNPSQLVISVKPSSNSRWNKGIWSDLHTGELLIDVEVFRKSCPELINKPEGSAS